MSLLVGLILTALIGPVGTESRGVAVFTHRDMAPLIERTFLLRAFFSCFWGQNIFMAVFIKVGSLSVRYPNE